MTEDKKFEEILRELGELLLDLGDLSSKVVLIGGQVLALESIRRGGSGVISIKTDTGPEVDRGFSYEPDLLFDLDGSEFMAERLPEVLKQRDYVRKRGFSWSKTLRGGDEMHLDLFAPADVEPSDLPTDMTPLPDARLAARRSQLLSLKFGDSPLRIHLPDAVGFLAMKVRAKLEQRPEKHKDSFDIFAYVKLLGSKAVLDSLAQAGQEGRELQGKLFRLFWNASAPGVRDVLEYAASLEEADRELLAQAAVDLFCEFG